MGPIGASVSGAYWAQHVLGTSNASHRMLAGCDAGLGGGARPNRWWLLHNRHHHPLCADCSSCFYAPCKNLYEYLTNTNTKATNTNTNRCCLLHNHPHPICACWLILISVKLLWCAQPSRPPRYLIHLPTYLAGYLICTTWYYLCTYQPTYLVTYAPSYAPNRWWLLHNLLHPLSAMLAHPHALCSTLTRSL